MCGGPVQQMPGTQSTLLPPTQSNGQFAGTRPWTSIPFMQTYGGHAAPWPDSNTQILNEWNGMQQGAGRFNGNAAARYGFAGPWQQQSDTRSQAGGMGGNGYSLRGDQPMNPMQGNQRYNPMPAVGMGGEYAGSGQYGNRPGTGGLEPPTNRGPMGGPDPMQGFQQLLQQDPRAASEALNFNPGWFQKNQGALAGMVGGDLGAWRNQTQPQGSNVGAITDEQRALIKQRMGW